MSMMADGTARARQNGSFSQLVSIPWVRDRELDCLLTGSRSEAIQNIVSAPSGKLSVLNHKRGSSANLTGLLLCHRNYTIPDLANFLEAARKAGLAPVSGVLDYAEVPSHSGLHLLCTPGNDVLATTGMAASGATLIVFTTGLGTPTGNPITPTVKVATNTQLTQRMPDIIDFDAGAVVHGMETIEQSGERMLHFLITVASGQVLTKAEQLGQFDFIPWQRGVNF